MYIDLYKILLLEVGEFKDKEVENIFMERKEPISSDQTSITGSF